MRVLPISFWSFSNCRESSVWKGVLVAYPISILSFLRIGLLYIWLWQFAQLKNQQQLQLLVFLKAEVVSEVWVEVTSSIFLSRGLQKFLEAGPAYWAHQWSNFLPCVTWPPGKQVFHWLSQGHTTTLWWGHMTTLYQVGKRKDRAEGATWEPPRSYCGRAGTSIHCPTRTAPSRGGQRQVDKENRAVGKLHCTECSPIKKLFSAAKDLELSGVRRWTAQDKRPRLVRLQEGTAPDRPASLGTKAYDKGDGQMLHVKSSFNLLHFA